MSRPPAIDISIIGTVGLPASYGGFETLAAQLVKSLSAKYRILVFCSSKRYPQAASRPEQYDGANLQYVSWDANGWQSIPYDFVSLWLAAGRSRTLLVLGVSGCLLLPILRVLWPRTRIVTNVDGLEWKRKKWGKAARAVLRASEWAAVRFSHAVIADNQGIREHILCTYGKESHLIAYGGDQASVATGDGAEIPALDTRFPTGSFYLSICRIEPENNIADILEAFACSPDQPLVLVGNWQHSTYARHLRERFEKLPNIELKDPIYDQARLKLLRESAKAYIHGHSAGGTNPSLVEAMHGGMPILAFDVNYNRHTTKGQAIYWDDAKGLTECLKSATKDSLIEVAKHMRLIAQQQYTWSVITNQYASILFPT